MTEKGDAELGPSGHSQGPVAGAWVKQEAEAFLSPHPHSTPSAPLNSIGRNVRIGGCGAAQHSWHNGSTHLDFESPLGMCVFISEELQHKAF